MIPKYLFHYTSIASLQKILQSQTIRFTRLDLLNDPYEGSFRLSDMEDSNDEIRRLIYCSCWNAEEKESINLWNIYTKMKGVRIKLKSTMFSEELKLKEQKSGFVPVGSINPIPIHIHEDLKNSFIKSVDGPTKIFYESSYENTYYHAVGKSVANKGKPDEFAMCDIDFSELGIKKIFHWQYEQEWRYKICAYSELHASDKIINKFPAYDSPDCIYVPLIGNIEEILLAPKVESHDNNTIISFMKEHKIDIPIKKSEIRIK